MIETSNELIIELLKASNENKEIFIKTDDSETFKRPAYINEDKLGLNIFCEDSERIHYPSSLLNIDIINICNEFDIDESIIEEKLIKVIDKIICDEINNLYNIADYYDEDKGYYYHKMDKLQKAKSKLFEKYNIE